MTNWGRGGWTGSINRIVRREVQEQVRENSAARRSQYSKPHRFLRRFFSAATFGRFLLYYGWIDAFFMAAEFLFVRFAPLLFKCHVPKLAQVDSQFILTISSYLLGVQVGVIGVLSLSIALVTLLAQKDSSSTDIQVYYHEALAFELVASCIALLFVLCVQLFWPAQWLLHVLSFSAENQTFKMGLLCFHFVWLLLNLAGLAHFTTMTLAFVHQSERERLRERYVVAVVYRRDMTKRLRETLYLTAAMELSGDINKGEPYIVFGTPLGNPKSAEIEVMFRSPFILHDIRVTWINWAIRRWIARCERAGEIRRRQHGVNGPALWLSPELDARLNGRCALWERRGGLPLTTIEKLVLRRSLRFRRSRDGA
jgi:hypothetical protein